MQHFSSIEAYCEAVNIAPPKHRLFDIRSFEQNMDTVVHRMPPFRHEFYAIAIKSDGEGKAVSGGFDDFPEGLSVFFNIPYQLLSWDIVPNWKGYYVMFTQDFLAQSLVLQHALSVFPFLRIDSSVPFAVDAGSSRQLIELFQRIDSEYYDDKSDKFRYIEALLYLLLTNVKRLFDQAVSSGEIKLTGKPNAIQIYSDYLDLIQSRFHPDSAIGVDANPLSTQYYARVLNIHPNYLNKVVKSVTGNTALKQIHQHVLTLSKAYLIQTPLSVKEIAYRLHFGSPNNFSSFFKRNAGLSPQEYRHAKQI